MDGETRPGSVGDFLGDAGPCPVVNWNGKAYQVSRPVPTVLARVELEVARIATEEVKALSDVLPAEDAADLKNRHHQGLLGRTHRAGGRQWQTTFENGQTGTLLILWSCVAERHPEFTMADAAAMARESSDDVEAALLLVAPDFFRLVGRAAGAQPDQVEQKINQFRSRHATTRTP